MPPCNKARNSKFHFGFQFSLKCYSFFSVYWIILIFFTRENRHIVPPCDKAGICTLDFMNFYSQIKYTVSFFSEAFWPTGQLVLHAATEVLLRTDYFISSPVHASDSWI